MLELVMCTENGIVHKHYFSKIVSKHTKCIFLAHQLQLALIATAREAPEIRAFFQNLVFIINIITSSSNIMTNQANQMIELEHLADTGEMDNGQDANQIHTLQCFRETRWSSHFILMYSLIRLYLSLIHI